LTKAVAEYLFDDQCDGSTDMSEFMEKHAVSRLIGAPGLCRL
jgi:ATP-dependent Clp protease ATP-binding subunit ClpA